MGLAAATLHPPNKCFSTSGQQSALTRLPKSSVGPLLVQVDLKASETGTIDSCRRPPTLFRLVDVLGHVFGPDVERKQLQHHPTFLACKTT